MKEIEERVLNSYMERMRKTVVEYRKGLFYQLRPSYWKTMVVWGWLVEEWGKLLRPLGLEVGVGLVQRRKKGKKK